jgi:hypothetical protein
MPDDLIEVTAGTRGQPPLMLTWHELATIGYMQAANHAGVRVWVSPLFWLDGRPVYPPIHLPPGPERRDAEAQFNARYHARRAEITKAKHTQKGPRYANPRD